MATKLKAEGMKYVDVAICGGGLAGLTLARQLKLQMPHLSVALLDKLTRPLPAAALKVGESTVEVGAYYLRSALDLSDYFESRHFKKLGLRFFFGDSQGPFEERPEFGLSDFPKVDSYQIDRGVLENDLRRLNAESGVAMLEGCKILDVELADGDEGRAEHVVGYRVEESGNLKELRARWVVDALGRRRLLQRKLGLTRPGKPGHSAVWLRIAGRVDVSDLVPEEAIDWHDRVQADRYYSTVHLMGDGYWVWLIPLSSGNTSIGIVAAEDLHPFNEFNTNERAREWLHRHEPKLAACLGDREPLDFLCMRRYSYSSRQILSSDRWACVGDAGQFADPFYSPGTDLIGFGNSITTEVIRLDFEDRLTPMIVKMYDAFMRGLNDGLTNNIQVGYPLFGNATVATAKIIWDTAAAWSLLAPQMFNSTYLDPAKRSELRRVTGSFFLLSRRMQALFTSWAAKSPNRFTFDFIDYLRIPFYSALRARNLQSGKSLEELVADQLANMKTLEALAQAFFLLALEDVMPEQLNRFKPPIWLNSWVVSLDPDSWESDGLFEPGTEPGDLAAVRKQIRSLFRYTRDEQPAGFAG